VLLQKYITLFAFAVKALECGHGTTNSTHHGEDSTDEQRVAQACGKGSAPEHGKHR